jgi:hypothetical protein
VCGKEWKTLFDMKITSNDFREKSLFVNIVSKQFIYISGGDRLLNYTKQYCMHAFRRVKVFPTLLLSRQKIGYAHFAQAQLCVGQHNNYFRRDT